MLGSRYTSWGQTVIMKEDYHEWGQVVPFDERKVVGLNIQQEPIAGARRITHLLEVAAGVISAPSSR